MKKKIAILVPKLSGGGAERVASNLSVYLNNEYYDKYVIVFETSSQDYFYDGTLVNLDLPPSKTLVGRLITFFKRVKKLKAIKKELRIVDTVSFLTRANILNILSKTEDKVIISVRNYMSKDLQGFIGMTYRILIKFLYNRADNIIAVSKAIKEDLITKFNIEEKMIDVIYNPYDFNKIKNMSKELIDPEHAHIFNGNVIINVGRLSDQKGQWHLIRIFGLIKKEFPDIKLVFIGDGPLKSTLMKMANDTNHSEDIHFMGFQNNPFKYIFHSDIFVFPSLYEGFPNALVEAMIVGKPVISSNCKSGPIEILAPDKNINIQINNIEHCKYGILIPVDSERIFSLKETLTINEKILADSLIEILRDMKLQKNLSEASEERARDFLFENIIADWDKILS